MVVAEVKVGEVEEVRTGEEEEEVKVVKEGRMVKVVKEVTGISQITRPQISLEAPDTHPTHQIAVVTAIIATVTKLFSA